MGRGGHDSTSPVVEEGGRGVGVVYDERVIIAKNNIGRGGPRGRVGTS